MRPSIPTLLAYIVVAVASIFVGQIPAGERTVGAHVVSRTKSLIDWVGKETSRSSTRMGEGLRRGVSAAENLSQREVKPGPSDDDLVTESDRRSLMRLLE